MTKVLFVCLGNICRSPMAEAIFRKKVSEAGLDDAIEVDSCGTSSWNEGDMPHQGTRDILAKLDLDVSDMQSRVITSEDFETYDYIIGMDESNLRDLEGIAPNLVNLEKIHLLLSEEIGCERLDVPDPYYTEDFDTTYDLIDQGTTKWLDVISKK